MLVAKANASMGAADRENRGPDALKPKYAAKVNAAALPVGVSRRTGLRETTT